MSFFRGELEYLNQNKNLKKAEIEKSFIKTVLNRETHNENCTLPPLLEDSKESTTDVSSS